VWPADLRDGSGSIGFSSEPVADTLAWIARGPDSSGRRWRPPGRFVPLGIPSFAGRLHWTHQTSTQSTVGATRLTSSSTLAPRSESQEPEEEVTRATTPGPNSTPRMRQSYSAPAVNTRSLVTPAPRASAYPDHEDSHAAANTMSPQNSLSSPRPHLTSPSYTAGHLTPYTFPNHLGLHTSADPTPSHRPNA
jgi:hypothetical protein